MTDFGNLDWISGHTASLVIAVAVIVTALAVAVWLYRRKPEASIFADCPHHKFASITTNLLSGWRREDPPNTRAIVFVHGFLGNSNSTWKAKRSARSFAELLLTDPDPRLSEFDVFLFQYKTSLLRKLEISTLATQLSNEIRSSLRGYDVVLAAHSLGGLVCMRYILDQLMNTEIGARTRIVGLIMFGTPTTGLEWARIVGLVGGIFGGKLRGVVSFFSRNLDDLSTAAQTLKQLHGEWILRVANGGSTTVSADHRTLLPVRVVTGIDDWVVPEYSAKGIYGLIDWIPVEADHRALVKPSAHQDLQYKAARDFLLRSHEGRAHDTRVKLAGLSDWVLRCADERLVRNWSFTLHFNVARSPADTKLLDLPAFSICELRESKATRVLPEVPLTVGVALGRGASETIRTQKGRETLYLHGIRLDAAKSDVNKTIADAIQPLLADAARAWESLIGTVRVQVSHEDEVHQLVSSTPKIVSDAVVCDFSIPEKGKHLVGKEVVIDLGFRSVCPRSLGEFTWHFDSPTDGCDVEIATYGTEFLVASAHALRATKFTFDAVEHVGSKRTLRGHSRDVILPDTVVRFRWSTP